jgi:hypothetical protein
MSVPQRMDFGRALRNAVRMRGYKTLAAFSAHSEVPYQRIKKWASNSTSPQLRSIVLVARKLGLAPHELVRMGEPEAFQRAHSSVAD